jgi:hypothetical protein
MFLKKQNPAFLLFNSKHSAAKNEEHFSEPPAKMSEGGVGRARCQRHKCVPRLRGTRKGGGVFEASDWQGQFMERSVMSGVRSALVVGCWLLVVGCWLLAVWFKNYDLKFNLRSTKTRNNERNTLLLRAFAICDNRFTIKWNRIKKDSINFIRSTLS